MSRAATTRFTEARTRSYAAPSGRGMSAGAKRRSTKFATGRGVMRCTNVPTLAPMRTRLRATREEPNISSPSSLRDSPTSVFTTLCAFFDRARENTIIRPAAKRNTGWVCAEALSESMLKLHASVLPEAAKSRNDDRPARGTPIKFTRSLPAKAVARAKVPVSTTMRNTFTFSACSNCMSSVNTTRHVPSTINICSSKKPFTSAVINERCFKPLKSMK